jgi:glycosyltransferase involved in cell wall biosynthesis
MHIALNGWFWNRPDTGSGQYVRGLVSGLRKVAPDVRLTLIAPEGWAINPPEGVDLVRVGLRGGGHLAKVRFEQADFPRAAAEAGADIAHVPYWGGPLSSPIPVVVTIHDLIPLVLPHYRGGLLARLYTGLVAASARGAAAVITDSPYSRGDILRHLGLPPEQVTAIPLAAGDEYHPRQGSLVDMAIHRKYGLPPEYVLYLGGFDVRKNVETLLKAFTYVKQGTGDMYPLILAGRPPERITPRFADVQKYIDLMDVGDVVRMIGEVEEADKPALYRMAKCFVFPSRYEGFGLPVLEAMACGTPVVAADASSIPDVMGDAGFLVGPDDARHMAGNIIAALIQEDVARDLRQKGLARAAQFSWARTARETLEVYSRIMENKTDGEINSNLHNRARHSLSSTPDNHASLF